MLWNVTQDQELPQVFWNDLGNGKWAWGLDFWNVDSLCRSDSLKKCRKRIRDKLDLQGVQEIKWAKGGMEQAHNCTSFCGNGKDDHYLMIGFFIPREVHQCYKGRVFLWQDVVYNIKRLLEWYYCSQCVCSNSE